MRRWRLIACAALALVQISKQADWESGARDGFLSSISPECDVMKPRWACAAALLCGYISCSYTVCVSFFFLFVFLMLGFGSQGIFPSPRQRSDTGQSPTGWEQLRDPRITQPVTHSYTNTHWRRSHLGTASINYARFNLCHSGSEESLKQCLVFKCRNISWIWRSC